MAGKEELNPALTNLGYWYYLIFFHEFTQDRTPIHNTDQNNVMCNLFMKDR